MNHLIRFLINKHKNQGQFKKINIPFAAVVSGVLLAGSAVMIALGSFSMKNSVQDSYFLKFDKFNNGLIVLVVGLALFLMMGCAFIYLVQGFRKKENVE